MQVVWKGAPTAPANRHRMRAAPRRICDAVPKRSRCIHISTDRSLEPSRNDVSSGTIVRNHPSVNAHGTHVGVVVSMWAAFIGIHNGHGAMLFSDKLKKRVANCHLENTACARHRSKGHIRKRCTRCHSTKDQAHTFIPPLSARATSATWFAARKPTSR